MQFVKYLSFIFLEKLKLLVYSNAMNTYYSYTGILNIAKQAIKFIFTEIIYLIFRKLHFYIS